MISCPEGKQLVAGGGSCVSEPSKGWVFLVVSRPVDDKTWRVSCDTPQEQNVKAEAWVICR